MRHVAQIFHIKVGRRASENENLTNNWENLDINNLAVPQGKTIFVFGGNTTNRPEAANGNAKIIKTLLAPEQAENTTILSFFYDSEPMKSEGYLVKDYINEAVLLYEKTFRPLIYDKKGYMKEMKGIEQAFDKIIFASHCSGNKFVNIIIDELYSELITKYPPKTAEMLINKIQLYSYAPYEMPSHNVNAFCVTPYFDPSYSWAKALDLAESQKVDLDYPKGIIKELMKAKRQTRFKECFDGAFKGTRAIMFKIGHTTYFIPSKMNPRTSVGDHSIECVAKPQFLNSGTDFQENAQLANFASKLFLNRFIKTKAIDSKITFNEISSKIEHNKPDVREFE